MELLICLFGIIVGKFKPIVWADLQLKAVPDNALSIKIS